MHGFADLPIRRGCVIIGLLALGAMSALAHQPVLALRLGAEVAAFLTLGLVLAAWQAPPPLTPQAPARGLRARPPRFLKPTRPRRPPFPL